MATAVIDAIPPSYEETIALFERWDSLTEDDQIKHQQEIINVLDKPTTIEVFSEQCKNIGQTAVDIDNAFNRVKAGFDDIVKNYSKEFPEVKTAWAPRWDGFMTRWGVGEQRGILWDSRDLASFAASELELYRDVSLSMVAEIKTDEDLKNAQKELQAFSTKKHPVDIKTDTADKFKNLRNDIQQFSTEFQQYFDDKKQILDKEAKRLEGVIKDLKDEIETLNSNIKKTLIALGCSGALGLAGLLITGTVLTVYLVARNKAQTKLDTAQHDLDVVNKKQKALAHLRSDFEALKPDIQIICDKLAIFAEVWASARSQAVDFKNKLDGGMQAVTKKGFQKTLELAMKTCAPLQEGLKVYATQIVHHRSPGGKTE